MLICYIILLIYFRPLSFDEITQYSVGCDSDFVENSKPEVISWTSALISITGNNFLTIMTSYEDFCQTNYNPKSVMIQGPFQYPYKESKHFCQQINGDMFFARNKTHLDYMISVVGLSVLQKSCKNKFSVPIVRSDFNQSQWVHDFQTDEEVSFEPWGKANPTARLGLNKCIHFDINSRS